MQHARIDEIVYTIKNEKPYGKKFVKPKRKREVNIKMDPPEIGYEGVYWI